MNRVVHFEIQADDLERASAFYSTVFGWTISTWQGEGMDYVMIMTAGEDSKEPGINGGMLKRPVGAPPIGSGANAYVCTIQVENYDETAGKIISAGGVEGMAKFALTGMAWQGYFVDTEGNTFGIHQPDPDAK